MADFSKQIDAAQQLARAGNHEGAKQALRKLPNRAQRDPETLYRIATILYEIAAWPAAVSAIDKLHKLIKHETVETLMLKGAALRSGGDPTAAAQAFRRASRMAPDDPDILYNLGNAFLDGEKFDDAVQTYTKVIERAPADAAALYQRGLSHSRNGDHDLACADLLRAAELEPGNVQTLISLGAAHAAAHRHGDAESALRRAFALAPDNPAVVNNLGNALTGQAKFEEGRGMLERALALAPEAVELHRNYAMTCIRMGDVEAGIEHLEGCHRQMPDDAAIMFELGNALICTGETARGWDLFERRMMLPAFNKSKIDLPWWDGRADKSKRVLIWSDQGIGDIIMFSQLLTALPEMLGGFSVMCDARLGNMFRRAYPDVDIIAEADGADPLSVQLAAYDAQTTMTFLVRWLDPDPSAREKTQAPYLAADPDRAAELGKAYRSRTDKTVVGIAWKSGNLQRAERNLPIASWGPILSRDDLFFVNLQYGDTDADLAFAKEAFGAEIFTDPAVDQMLSLDDFAAQIAAMDKIVSISNSTVHVAGAIGTDVRVMLPKFCDWRYGMWPDETTWYPTMRLYRQQTAGVWADVIQRANDDL